MSLNAVRPITSGDGRVRLDFRIDTNISFEGATINWVLRKDCPTGDIVLQKTGIITDADLRKFSVYLEKSETEELSGRYVHGATITDENGNRATIYDEDGSNSGIIHIASSIVSAGG